MLYTLHTVINDVAGGRMYTYKIFFVNFWVITLWPVFVY